MTSRHPLALATLTTLLFAGPSAMGRDGAAPAATPTEAQSGGTSAENKTRLDELAAKVELEYVIGPGAAADLGYRIMWQAKLPLAKDTPFEHTHLAGDAIFAVDRSNSVVRLRPSDGQQIWRVSVASPVDIFRGIDWIETPIVTNVLGRRQTAYETRVYISTDTECFVLDGSTGSIAARQDFHKLPTTTPMNIGKFLIYGTLGGQVVWHHAIVGQEWRANSLDNTIRGSLAHGRGMVIAASDHGMIMALDEDTATRRWMRRTFGGVLASPAVSDDAVYVACLDQYLWAFDLSTGETRWKYFTQSALKTPPFPMADVVLQFVPGEGLVCFNAITPRIDGDVRWRNATVVGTPVGIVQTAGGDRITLWEPTTHTLTLVDPKLGSVDKTFTLPAAAELQLVTSGPFAGDIFATAHDGRILRLTPKFAKAVVPVEEKPVASEPPLSIPPTEASEKP
jgi:outer membrane protein assembly factor BamB